MTTEQRMFARIFRAAPALIGVMPRIALLLAIMSAALAAGGCAGGDRLTAPRTLTSPYRAIEGDLLWAVAPLRNESATSLVDPLMVSDAMVNRIQEVKGISALAMNRTLGAMRAIGLEQVDSPQAARRLAEALGADAIVVGTITAWDPYEPPEIGVTVTLYAVSDRMHAPSQRTQVDPRAMQAAASDDGLESTEMTSMDGPVAARGEHFDGANHEVQMLVRTYAEGRHESRSALGWRRYLASMPLFTEFACYTLVDRLLDVERIRLAQLAAGDHETR